MPPAPTVSWPRTPSARATRSSSARPSRPPTRIAEKMKSAPRRASSRSVVVVTVGAPGTAAACSARTRPTAESRPASRSCSTTSVTRPSARSVSSAPYTSGTRKPPPPRIVSFTGFLQSRPGVQAGTNDLRTARRENRSRAVSLHLFHDPGPVSTRPVPRGEASRLSLSRHHDLDSGLLEGGPRRRVDRRVRHHHVQVLRAADLRHARARELGRVGEQDGPLARLDHGPLDRHLDDRRVHHLPTGAHSTGAEEEPVGMQLAEVVLGEETDQGAVLAADHAAEQHQLDALVV